MTQQEKLNNGAATEVKEPVAPPAQPVVQASLYEQARAMVESMVPWDKFRKGTAGSGVSVFDNGGGRGTRLLKLVESKKGLRVEFNVDIESQLKALAPTECTIFTEQQAKDKHMGTCRWIYTGSNLEVLKQLIAASLAGFAPKVKEEPKKEEKAAPAAEAPKTPEKPAEPVKASRQLTAEEIKQMDAMKGNKNKLPQEQKKAQ